MNVLLLGGSGQLGKELLRADWPSETCLCAPGRSELDVTDFHRLAAVVDGQPWDLVINAAAYTAVDLAESEPDQCFTLNRDVPGRLAELCAENGIPLIHVSTDYVFDGTKAEAYTESDSAKPINVYGSSKFAGEEAIRRMHAEHVILRTSWLYSAHRRNFIKSILRMAEELDELRIVDDQYGCPTSAVDLTSAIVQIVTMAKRGETIKWGTYHYAGRGATTWCGLAKFTIETAGLLPGRRFDHARRPEIVPIQTTEYPTPARRPANSRLDCERISQALGISTRLWQVSCRAVVHECIALRNGIV